ncbi:myb/SANT-like DNA-binding domain-containing protein 3 [Tribolium castaneum]|uniref:myb/SANT-like DNA-binding domain-containing protein 3 n=1 Tax=Tribolium castaneum TaxID=7070 RepID=UPI0030FF04A0
MTEAKVHRERTKNFTEREKEIALDIINRYQNKIENKETDGVSQKERKDAWEKVAEEFNSASSTAPRTGKQMKVLWSNLRRTAKKNIAKENKKRYLDETNELGNIAELKRKKNEDKKNISKTGGGTFESQLTDVGARVLAMVEPQARPLPNLFDDDNIYHKGSISSS